MDEARIDRAMNRIEAAFRRVEKAALKAVEHPSGNGSRDDELRQRVGSVLAELDAVIGDMAR